MQQHFRWLGLAALVGLVSLLTQGAALQAAPKDAPGSKVVEKLLRAGKPAEALEAAYAALG